MLNRVGSRLVIRMPLLIYRLFRRTTEEYMDDNCPSMAAAMSFYILLCIFPLALAAISILGFVLHTPSIEEKVIDAMVEAIPVSRDFLRDTIRSVVNARGGAGLIATLGLAWAGMALFGIVRKGLNIAFGITMPKPYFTERLREFLMMMAAGFLLLISLASTTFLGVLRQWSLNANWPSPLDSKLMWQGGGALLAFALTYVTFTLLYKFVPYARLHWRDILLGAFIGTLGFELFKWGFAWYVQNYVNYNILYGSLGAVVAFMVWAYMSATALLYGAEVASVFPRVLTAWLAPPPSMRFQIQAARLPSARSPSSYPSAPTEPVEDARHSLPEAQSPGSENSQKGSSR